MRITELLKRESIELDVAADSKEEAIDKLVSLMDAGGRLNDNCGVNTSGCSITSRPRFFTTRPRKT